VTLINESSKQYFSIIEEAKIENRIKGNRYYERHHIIPRSLGGSDKNENIILLTPEEHYECHGLLPDFCEGQSKHKMIKAWHLINYTRNIDTLDIIGPEKYAKLKREYAEINSSDQKAFYKTPDGILKAKEHSLRLKGFLRFG